jgi:hypothetical protein
MYESLPEVTAWFSDAGWRASNLSFVMTTPTVTRAQALEKLRLRTYSTFEQLTEEEIGIGFEELERAVAADPDSAPPSAPATLLTLVRN